VGRSEPDQEIQDLLRASVGLNLGLRYLPNAIAFNSLLAPPPDPDLAARIVWFDAYVTNVDRTDRNVNMLLWQEDLWLIDHGACLYFHHSWDDYLARSRSPFPLIKAHTLLPLARNLAEVDQASRQQLTAEDIRAIVNLIPAAWLNEPLFSDPAEQRAAYVAYLLNRLEASAIFVEEALRAQAQLV
jgi:hypothetical protein